MTQPIDYLHPDLPAGLPHVRMPVVDATAATLTGYGRLVDDPAHCQVGLRRSCGGDAAGCGGGAAGARWGRVGVR